MTTKTINKQFDIVLEDIQGPNSLGAQPKFNIKGANIGNGLSGTGLIDVDVGAHALVVQCDLVQAVHGFLYGDQPGTLAIFQFKFVPRGNNRRFKKVEITTKFSAGEVQDIAPSQEWDIFKSESEEEVSHSVSPNLEASYGFAKGNIGYTWELKKSRKLETHARVQGMIRSQGHAHFQGRMKNTVFWGLYENQDTRSGIPSFMQTAVLMKRGKSQDDDIGQRFSATITISGDLDRVSHIKDGLESLTASMSGGCVKGEDVVFDRDWSHGTIQSRGNLLVEKLENYQRLITVRDWVEGDANPLSKTEPDAAVPRNKSVGSPEKFTSEPFDDHKSSANEFAATSSLTSSDISSSATLDTAPLTLDSHVQNHELDSAPQTTSTAAPTPITQTAAINDTGFSNAHLESSKASDHKVVDADLTELRNQLSTVRIEASLVRRLIMLEKKEQEIMQEIMRLENLT